MTAEVPGRTGEVAEARPVRTVPVVEGILTVELARKVLASTWLALTVVGWASRVR